MAHFSDTAIVLRRIDFSETSQIISLFTRGYGKVSVIAKGIKRGTKKRFASGLDMLEVGQAVWTARPDRQQNLATLVEWRQQRAYAGLRESLGRLYAAEYAAEVVSELTKDNDPHQGLFSGLLRFLEEVADSDSPLVSLFAFQHLLLVEVGLVPQALYCVGCRTALNVQESAAVHFSSHEGGFVCRDCEPHYVEKRSIDPRVVAALADGALAGAPPAALFDLFNYHISHLIGKEPRLAEFVLPAVERRQLKPT